MWAVSLPATKAADFADRVTLKKCSSSLPEPIIMPTKVISLSGGRRRFSSGPSLRPS